ncbi:hypothetical protein hp2017_1541 [Helicobacter pylori 2017]|nr:hypothetical protein hp2017_1541 [Helicobacter pylori 2017]
MYAILYYSFNFIPTTVQIPPTLSKILESMFCSIKVVSVFLL